VAKQGKQGEAVNKNKICTHDFFTAVRRDIDFAWIYWGWTGIEAEQRGVKLDYLPLKEIDPVLDYYTPVLVANEKWLAANPDLARQFLEATSRGYEFCIKQPDAAAQVLLKAAPELNADLVKASQRYLASQYQDDAARWGEMRLEVWERYAQWLYENRVLDRPIAADQAFTNDYLP